MKDTLIRDFSNIVAFDNDPAVSSNKQEADVKANRCHFTESRQPDNESREIPEQG